MPTDNMDNLREKTIESLKNFPKVLEPYWELVEDLERMFKFNKKTKPLQMLKEWEKHSDLEQFYFLGWMRAGIKKMGITAAMRFILLSDKKKIDAALVTILDYASMSELEAFAKGEDSIK